MAKILIVDDNRDNRRVLSRLIEFGGHDAITASHGREALDRLASDSPDLVLMDLAMPEMDGWRATETIKSDEALRSIPVIVVTGHVTKDDISRAQQVGCEDVVSKPIDYYILMDKIQRHLAAGDGRAA